MTFLSPGDPDYAKAKRIRQGTETLPEVLVGFVDAFEEKYGVRPLSVDTDTVRTNTPWTPRLSVVLERSAEAQLFKKDMFAFDRTKQVGTARLFLRAVPARRLRRLFGLPLFGHRVENWSRSLFVLFTDFEQVAKQDAHDSVTAAERAAFEEALGLGDRLWRTERLFGAPIVFVRTDAQVQEVSRSELDRWADVYFEIVRSHDEFGYLQRGEIMIGIDAKETLDRDYQGNLYYYFK